MTWFRVDDSFNGHPKAAGITNDALATWTRAGDWCAWQETDGAVPRGMLLTFTGNAADPDEAAAELVDRNLWELTGTGWQFHDWGDWNPLRADLEAKRKLGRDRWHRWSERRRDRANDGLMREPTHELTREPTHELTDQPTQQLTHSANADPTRPDPSLKPSSSTDRNHSGGPAAEDDDDGHITAVFALLHPLGPISREQVAAWCSARLTGRSVANATTYLLAIARKDPRAAHREALTAAPRSTGPVTTHRTVADVVADAQRPGGPAEDVEGRATDARKALANRPAPERPTVDPGRSPELHGPELAAAQLAQSRAQVLTAPEPEPVPEPEPEPELAEADLPDW